MRVLALVVAVLVCVRPAAAQSTTFLYFTSQHGDYIGQGQNWVYTPADATFAATFDGRNAVSIDLDTPSTFWWAAFAAPGDVPLTPGTYLNATRYPFNGAAEPGLSLSGDGRGCNTLTGRFTVLEVVYGAGNTVTRFAADFEQHCEGANPALIGAVRYNSTVPPPVTVTHGALDVGPGASAVTMGVANVIPNTTWTATTSAPWLTIPGSGGSGPVTLTIGRNTSTAPRSASVTIGSTVIPVTQRGNGVPGAPDELTAATANGTLQLAWQPPGSGGDALTYRLEAGTQPGAMSMGVDLAGSATTAAFPGVPPGRYYLRITASNEFGVGPPSPEFVLDMTSGTTVPGRPRILTAAVVDGVLTMTWEPPTPQGDVTGYVLEAGTHPTVMNLGSTRLGPATTFTYRMVFGGNYFLRIRAVNAGGIGPASAEVMIRSGAYMAPPPAPAGLTATVTGSTVTFAWTEPTPLPGEAATRFRIEAGSAPGNTGVSVFVPALPTSATFANVPPGRYYVRVRGEGPRGPGAASNEVLVVVP